MTIWLTPSPYDGTLGFERSLTRPSWLQLQIIFLYLVSISCLSHQIMSKYIELVTTISTISRYTWSLQSGHALW